jgi:hypothetical protein
VGLAPTGGDAGDVAVFSSVFGALTSFFDEKSRRKKPGLGFALTDSCVGGNVGTGGISTAVAAIVPAVPGLEDVCAFLLRGVPGGLAPGVLGRS